MSLRLCFASGQISMYMIHTKVRYGFLSTYNQIMFFKQEPLLQSMGRYVLWYSPVIHHSTVAQAVEGDQPQSFWGKVSLRECFMFLADKIQSDNWEADNPMPKDNWYLEGKLNEDVEDDTDEDIISESSESSESAESSEHQPEAPGGHNEASEQSGPLDVPEAQSGLSSPLSDPPSSPQTPTNFWTDRERRLKEGSRKRAEMEGGSEKESSSGKKKREE
ncbi:hypothetical protein VTN77DRAFT_1023 [Rasamsonia byssochlamydoides]|uniref:uncharacterized protein n=1 Tax=Rasamsonia byssochlamydoides TaxID=89139 RepID=UPI003741EBD4